MDLSDAVFVVCVPRTAFAAFCEREFDAVQEREFVQVLSVIMKTSGKLIKDNFLLSSVIFYAIGGNLVKFFCLGFDFLIFLW